MAHGVYWSLFEVERNNFVHRAPFVFSEVQHHQARMTLLSAAVLTVMSISCLHQGPSTVNGVLLIPGWVRHGHPLTQQGCLKLSAS